MGSLESDVFHTMDPQHSFDEKLEGAFEELAIAEDRRRSIRKYLDLLKEKHRGTYEHSIRVGLMARRIARHRHLDEKALLYAGLLHDVGKSQVPVALLQKTGEWTPEDTAAMDAHVLHGYQLLRGTFDFSAEVVALHHQFQERKYPTEAPPFLHQHSESTRELIRTYGRILALADVYDALHRVNGKFDEHPLSGGEVKEQILRLNPDQAELIEELYCAGVFAM